MKIQLVSDLHLEFFNKSAEAIKFIASLQTNADVLVCAGDITTLDFLPETINQLSDMYENVVYVTGNHEYYGSSFAKVHEALTSAKENYKNFHWLNNEMIEIDSIRFFGGTMWFARQGGVEEYWTRRRLNDFHNITDFRVTWWRPCEEHERFKEFLYKSKCGEKDIVVTHHLPYKESSPLRFRNSKLNCFYVTDMSEIILDKQPRMWLHGHTHDSCYYRLGHTDIIANPCGYYGENKKFKKNLVINLKDG